MLTDRAYRVYHVIVEEIMLHEGPIPLHERSLAGKANRSIRDFNAAMTELVAAGKLEVRGGFVGNSRCENELRSIRDNRENAASGGRKSGETRATSSKNNDLDEAPLPNNSNIKEKRREEVEKKEKREPSVPCPKPVRTQYPDDFERFWSGYPTDANMSKKEAHQAWQRLAPEDRLTAIASLPAFRSYCQAHTDYRPIHANGYLSKARFEGFVKVAQMAAETSVYILQSDARWPAWERYFRKTKGSAPPTDARGGWRFPSETPPEENAA